MHSYKISKLLQKKMQKLSKKDRHLHDQLLHKINEIVSVYGVEHYKNLHYNLKDSKRVHIGHFVLIFQLNKQRNEILFDDFDHHDVIYMKR